MGFKKILNYFSFALLGILAIPTAAILISWNALPGERLYTIKRNLEKIALVVADTNFKTEAGLRSRLVKRRFDEATTLLNRSSALGLTELTAEIESAKKEIVKQAQEEKKEKEEEIVEEEAGKLIAQLQKYDQKLEEKKQALPTRPTSPTAPTTAPTPIPVKQTAKKVSSPKPVLFPPKTSQQAAQPIQPSPQTTPTTTQPPQNVVVSVDQTQQQIQQAIEELEQVVREQKKEKEKKEKHEDREKEDKEKKDKEKEKD